MAGRIAADLEPQVLADERLATQCEQKQLTLASSSWQNQLPQLAPLVHGWDVARSSQAGELGGTVHDYWFALGGDALAVVAAALSRVPAAQSCRFGTACDCPCRLAAAKSRSAVGKSQQHFVERLVGHRTGGAVQAVLQAGAGHVRVASAGPARSAFDRPRSLASAGDAELAARQGRIAAAAGLAQQSPRKLAQVRRCLSTPLKHLPTSIVAAACSFTSIWRRHCSTVARPRRRARPIGFAIAHRARPTRPRHSAATAQRCTARRFIRPGGAGHQARRWSDSVCRAAVSGTHC